MVSLSGEYHILFLRLWREKFRIPVGPGITVERIGLCYAHPTCRLLCFAMPCYILAMFLLYVAMPVLCIVMFLL